MKAVVFHEHGTLDNLRYEDISDPHPKANEVLIRVCAVALNGFDPMVLRGIPGLKTPLPMIPGADIAGEIVALGSDIAPGRWAIGDRVTVVPNQPSGMMGETKRGGASELVAVEQDYVLPIPDEVSFVDAACLPVAYGTALRMIETRGQLQCRRKGADPRRQRRRWHLLRPARQGDWLRGDRLRQQRMEAGEAQAAWRRSRHRHFYPELRRRGSPDVRQAAHARRRRGRRDHQLHRRRHMGRMLPRPEAAGQAPHLRSDGRLRPEDRHSLYLVLRVQHHRIERLDPGRPARAAASRVRRARETGSARRPSPFPR